MSHLFPFITSFHLAITHHTIILMLLVSFTCCPLSYIVPYSVRMFVLVSSWLCVCGFLKGTGGTTHIYTYIRTHTHTHTHTLYHRSWPHCVKPTALEKEIYVYKYGFTKQKVVSIDPSVIYIYIYIYIYMQNTFFKIIFYKFLYSIVNSIFHCNFLIWCWHNSSGKQGLPLFILLTCMAYSS